MHLSTQVIQKPRSFFFDKIFQKIFHCNDFGLWCSIQVLRTYFYQDLILPYIGCFIFSIELFLTLRFFCFIFSINLSFTRRETLFVNKRFLKLYNSIHFLFLSLSLYVIYKLYIGCLHLLIFKKNILKDFMFEIVSFN